MKLLNNIIIFFSNFPVEKRFFLAPDQILNWVLGKISEFKNSYFYSNRDKDRRFSKDTNRSKMLEYACKLYRCA